jgi:hypothetical protein
MKTKLSLCAFFAFLGATSIYSAMPADLAAAKNGTATRLQNVVLSEIKYYPRNSSGAIDWANFGVWDPSGGKIVMARMLAGMQAARILPAGNPNRPADLALFSTQIKNFVMAKMTKFEKAGTDNGDGGDYDMLLVKLAQIMYEFKDRPDILNNDAMWWMMYDQINASITAAVATNGGRGFDQWTQVGLNTISLPGYTPSVLTVGVNPTTTSVYRSETIPARREWVSAHFEGEFGTPSYRWVEGAWYNYPEVTMDRYYSVTITGKQYEIPYIGNNPNKMMNYIQPLSYPETENHVLMTNVWSYLVNQLLEKNPRGDSRVSAFFNKSPNSYRNDGSYLEDMLMSALARIVQNGYFETNGRMYQAASLQAILTLYSYADATTPSGMRIRAAAKNALDYTAIMWTFQSMEGKRYAPSRRNISYRANYGLYQNEYMPAMMGVISGVHSYDDSPACAAGYCGFAEAQPRAFALCAASSRYAVPDPVWDMMINRGVVQKGNAFSARMQARFTERHYIQGAWPRYAVDPATGSNRHGDPDLRNGNILATPEIYFGTEDYLNSAGGNFRDHIPLDLAQLGDYDVENVYDRFAKYSAIIPKGNVNWTSLTDGQNKVVMGGQDFTGCNIGTYKNFSYLPVAVQKLPLGLIPQGQPRVIGSAAISLYTAPAGHSSGLEKHILVYGTFQGRSFWEVVPGAKRTVAEIDNQLYNSGNTFPSAGGNAYYTTIMSGEKLTLSTNIATGTYWNRPIIEIDYSAAKAKQNHVNFETQSEINAFPLIEVRELNSSFFETGRNFVYSNGNGIVEFNNPRVGPLYIDSRSYKNPTSSNALGSNLGSLKGGIIPIITVMLQ